MAGLEKSLIRLIVAATALGWFAVSPAGASTVRESRQAKKAYEKSDYQAASETYQKGLEKSPESDVLNFGMGTTLYKQEKYPQAIQHLEKSLLSPNPDLQAMAQYNLGNSYYHDGIRQEDSNLPQAVQQLEKSLEHYTSALKHNDKDEDAKYNYEFVRKELEQLKEKLKNQPQKNSSSKDQSQQKSDDQKKQEQQPSGTEGQKKDQQDQSAGNDTQTPQDSPGENQQDKKEEDMSGTPELDQPAPGTESTPSQNGNIPKGQLSPAEAQGVLENYQDNEEPKGFLNFMKNKGQESPVLNDW
jgi:tetratricopeptide (TPR) repeat protein